MFGIQCTFLGNIEDYCEVGDKEGYRFLLLHVRHSGLDSKTHMICVTIKSEFEDIIRENVENDQCKFTFHGALFVHDTSEEDGALNQLSFLAHDLEPYNAT